MANALQILLGNGKEAHSDYGGYASRMSDNKPSGSPVKPPSYQYAEAPTAPKPAAPSTGTQSRLDLMRPAIKPSPTKPAGTPQLEAAKSNMPAAPVSSQHVEPPIVDTWQSVGQQAAPAAVQSAPPPVQDVAPIKPPQTWNAQSKQYENLPRDYSQVTDEEYAAAQRGAADMSLSEEAQLAKDMEDSNVRVGYQKAQDGHRAKVLEYLRSQGIDTRGDGWTRNPRDRKAVQTAIQRGYGKYLDPNTLQTAMRLGLA